MKICNKKYLNWNKDLKLELFKFVEKQIKEYLKKKELKPFDYSIFGSFVNPHETILDNSDIDIVVWADFDGDTDKEINFDFFYGRKIQFFLKSSKNFPILKIFNRTAGHVTLSDDTFFEAYGDYATAYLKNRLIDNTVKCMNCGRLFKLYGENNVMNGDFYEVRNLKNGRVSEFFLCNECNKKNKICIYDLSNKK